jgi:hypothetical protein
MDLDLSLLRDPLTPSSNEKKYECTFPNLNPGDRFDIALPDGKTISAFFPDNGLPGNS